MASRDDYAVGWVCVLPIEVAAAKATLDCVHDNLLLDRNSDDNNNYILGSLQGHNIVVAYPNLGVCGKTSVADVATQLHASYTSVQFNLMVGVAGGVPGTKEDIRRGDVVVSKSTARWLGVVQYDLNGERTGDQFVRGRALDQPTPLLLTAMGKAETAAIFDESKMPWCIVEAESFCRQCLVCTPKTLHSFSMECITIFDAVAWRTPSPEVEAAAAVSTTTPATMPA